MLKSKVSIVILLTIITGFISSSSILANEQYNTNLEDSIKRAEKIGNAIYEKDAISKRAIKTLIEKYQLPPEKQIQGLITIPLNEGWLVRFVGEELGQYLAFYDVFILGTTEGEPKVNFLNPPEILDSKQQGMFRAKQTALNKFLNRFMIISK